MIWVAWRQHRAALLALAGYALVVIAAFVVLRFQFVTDLEAFGALDCLDDPDSADCRANEDYVFRRYDFEDADQGARIAIFGFALLVGVFLGAPMFAREWEQRTHLLALSQSVSARRWFTTRLGVVLGFAVLGATVLSGVYWAVQSSLGASLGEWHRLRPGYFEVKPVAFIGYTVFAVALGMAAGLLLRRTLPAMAVTLAGAMGAIYAVKSFVRPHYATPVVSVEPFDGTFPGLIADPARWSLGQGFSDTNGRFVTFNDDTYRAQRICEEAPGEYIDPAYRVCMAEQGFSGKAVNVHPGDRFWPFQFVEFGLFAVVAGALIALSLWWLRKRPS